MKISWESKKETVQILKLGHVPQGSGTVFVLPKQRPPGWLWFSTSYLDSSYCLHHPPDRTRCHRSPHHQTCPSSGARQHSSWIGFPWTVESFRHSEPSTQPLADLKARNSLSTMINSHYGWVSHLYSFSQWFCQPYLKPDLRSQGRRLADAG